MIQRRVRSEHHALLTNVADAVIALVDLSSIYGFEFGRALQPCLATPHIIHDFLVVPGAPPFNRFAISLAIRPSVSPKLLGIRPITATFPSFDPFRITLIPLASASAGAGLTPVEKPVFILSINPEVRTGLFYAAFRTFLHSSQEDI